MSWPEAGAAAALVLWGVVLAGAIALVLRRWFGRRATEAARLRTEQARVQRLLGLIDGLVGGPQAGVVWRTDAAHRLVMAQPPADGWTPTPRAPLWQRFEIAPGGHGDASLEHHLQSGGPLALLDVVPVPDRAARDNAPVRQWRLRALPCFDEAGHFAGHEGVAVAVAAPNAAAETSSPPTGPAGAAQGASQSEEAASFSYSVSHDLRAPIRVVEGFAKILKEDYGPGLDRIGNDHIDRVLAAAARMHNMIDALLALSRLGTQPLARQTVNLSQLATYVIEDLRRHSPERRVEAIVEPGLQAVGDPILLRVVLENLLGNAWKYSAQRNLATIEFSQTAQAGRTAFCVADNGAGFDMRFADRLFGVFQRLHSSSDFAGTGVGLATVRRIVHRHGGDIWAEAEVDRGARFHFTLPG
jgi:signal transduction histidine kinase